MTETVSFRHTETYGLVIVYISQLKKNIMGYYFNFGGSTFFNRFSLAFRRWYYWTNDVEDDTTGLNETLNCIFITYPIIFSKSTSKIIFMPTDLTSNKCRCSRHWQNQCSLLSFVSVYGAMCLYFFQLYQNPIDLKRI